MVTPEGLLIHCAPSLGAWSAFATLWSSLRGSVQPTVDVPDTMRCAARVKFDSRDSALCTKQLTGRFFALGCRTWVQAFAVYRWILGYYSREMGAGQRHGSDTPNKDTMMWIDSDDVLASDFDHVADLFLIEGIDLPPSQWHGCIVGLLVSGLRADELLGAMGHALQESITGDLMIASEQSAKASLRALRDPNYGFSPLIPDDDD